LTSKEWWYSLLNKKTVDQWLSSAKEDESQPSVRVALLCLALDSQQEKYFDLLGERDELREMLAEAEEELERLRTVEYVFGVALRSLLDARDFLGYQLSHANGGMSDLELDCVAQRYLRKSSLSTWEENTLKKYVAVLAKLIPNRLDAEVINTIFNYPIELASKILVEGATRELEESKESIGDKGIK
jgi:hypothetical protein